LGGSSSPSKNNEYFNGFNSHFNSSMAITIVVLSALFFVGFCIGGEESGRNSRRRPRGSGNVQGTRGLDRKAIESFPVFRSNLVKDLKAQTKETLDCAVCLSEFEDDEQLRWLPKCSHAFHPDCIDTWLFSHTTCPVCRTSLVPTDDGNPTDTSYGIIEIPEITPPYEAAVVVDGTRNSRSVRRDNNIETTVDSERADFLDSPGVLGLDQATEIRPYHP